MNSAEKARLAREKLKEQKQQNKARLCGGILAAIAAVIIAIPSVTMIALTAVSQVKNLEGIAKILPFAKYTLGGTAIAAVICLIMSFKSYDSKTASRLATIGFVLLGLVFLLGIAVIGANGMIKAA